MGKRRTSPGVEDRVSAALRRNAPTLRIEIRYAPDSLAVRAHRA